MSPRENLCVIAALVLGVALSTAADILVPTTALSGGPRPPRLSRSVDPVIRNRHGAVLPFNTALFPQLYNREAWFGAITTPTITTTPLRGHPGTVTVTSTKTIVLRAGTVTSYQTKTDVTTTVTSYQTKTDVTTLYATKTVVQGFAQPQGIAKIIQFDHAATANPNCGLEFATTTVTKSEFVNECSPSTTTITTNPFNTVTETVTAEAVTETYKSVIVNSKSTDVLAVPSGTVTNIVTVLTPLTFVQSIVCDLVTEYKTVTESVPVRVSEVCPYLETTVTKSLESGAQSTVTILDQQTTTTTETVNDIAVCSDAVTETASATRLAVLNYIYLTETIKERGTYARSCASLLVTSTETINPTKTTNLMQVSLVTEFVTTSDSQFKCPDTVTVTPTVVTTEVIHLPVTLATTVVKSSFEFSDAGTAIVTVVPTVKVTDTETIEVTATKMMADHFCAVIPI